MGPPSPGSVPQTSTVWLAQLASMQDLPFPHSAFVLHSWKLLLPQVFSQVVDWKPRQQTLPPAQSAFSSHSLTREPPPLHWLPALHVVCELNPPASKTN